MSLIYGAQQENPLKSAISEGVVRVVRLERTVTWSQTYPENFFRSFIAVFSRFLFVLLTL